MTDQNKTATKENRKLYAALFCYLIAVGSCVLLWGGLFLENIDTISPWHPLNILTIALIIGLPIGVVWGLYHWQNHAGYITVISLPFFIQLNLQSSLVLFTIIQDEKGLGVLVVFIFFIMLGGPAILLLPGAGLLAWRLSRLAKLKTETTDTNVEVHDGWPLTALKTLIVLTTIPTLLATAYSIYVFILLQG